MVRRALEDYEGHVPGEPTPPQGTPVIVDEPTPVPVANKEGLDGAVLSLEETALIMKESADAAMSLDSEIEQAERLADITTALEELASVADGIPEITETHAALVENIGKMAVTGTDISPEAVTPALEAHVDNGALLRGTAKDIIRAILAWLKNIWNSFENFFRLIVTIPTLINQAIAAQKVLKEIGAPKKDMTNVKLRIAATSVSANDQVLGKSKDMLKAFGDVEEIVKYTLDDYCPAIVKKAETVIDVLGIFSPDRSNAAVAQLADHLEGLRLPSIPGSGNALIVGNDELYIGKPLLGNWRVQMKTNIEHPDSPALGALERYRRASVTIANGDVVETPGDVLQVERMSPNDMKSALETCVDICKMLHKFYRGATYTKMMKTRDNLEAMSLRISTLFNAFDENSMSTDAITHYRALVGFNGAYAGWVRTPLVPVYQKAIANVNTILAVVSASMKGYEMKA